MHSDPLSYEDFSLCKSYIGSLCIVTLCHTKIVHCVSHIESMMNLMAGKGKVKYVWRVTGYAYIALKLLPFYAKLQLQLFHALLIIIFVRDAYTFASNAFVLHYFSTSIKIIS